MSAAGEALILAPLRGVTIRAFREVFAPCLVEAGFTEAVTPFVTAQPGYDPLKDRELRPSACPLPLTVQFLGKDPEAFGAALRRIRAAGFAFADLNCGCPFPMVRNKFRGSGLLRTWAVLERMLRAGCEALGPGRLSVKARLGVERPDELLGLMEMLNRFPLRHLTVHARTARQMYAGACDLAAFERVRAAAAMPVVYNGDATLLTPRPVMVGRAFVRDLGERPDIGEYLARYIDFSAAELAGERPVLGRLKELVAYWRESPHWRRRWQVVKLARTLAELKVALV